VNGFSLSRGYADESHEGYALTLTRTPGDDVVYAGVDPADATLVRLSLNGAWHTLRTTDFPLNTSLRILGGDPALARYAERRALLAFGVDFDGARRLARDIRARDIADRAGVRAAIAEIKRQKRLERDPPVVAAQDGWSPVAACAALAGLGVKAGDYHRTPYEWWAQAPSVKVAEGLFEPRVSYYVAGVEGVATRLRLHLQADLLAPGGDGDHAYARLVERLLGWALGEAAVAAVSPHVLTGEVRTFRFDLAEVSLEHHTWGKGKQSGYSRGVVIRHRAHVEPTFG
jgi:hypothetical protein